MLICLPVQMEKVKQRRVVVGDPLRDTVGLTFHAGTMTQPSTNANHLSTEAAVEMEITIGRRVNARQDAIMVSGHVRTFLFHISVHWVCFLILKLGSISQQIKGTEHEQSELQRSNVLHCYYTSMQSSKHGISVEKFSQILDWMLPHYIYNLL